MTVDTAAMRLFANSIESTEIYEHPYGKRAASTQLYSAADELDGLRRALESERGAWHAAVDAHEATKRELEEMRERVKYHQALVVTNNLLRGRLESAEDAMTIAQTYMSADDDANRSLKHYFARYGGSNA